MRGENTIWTDLNQVPAVNMTILRAAQYMGVPLRETTIQLIIFILVSCIPTHPHTQIW